MTIGFLDIPAIRNVQWTENEIVKYLTYLAVYNIVGHGVPKKSVQAFHGLNDLVAGQASLKLRAAVTIFGLIPT